MSELISAVIGAAVAGLIALVLQWQNLGEQRKSLDRQRDSDERARAETQAERDSVLAFSLCLKLDRIATDLGVIRDHIANAKALAEKDGISLGAALVAFSADVPKVEIPLDELVLAKRCSKARVLNDLLDLPHVHGMYVDNIGVIRTLREELTGLISVNELREDGRASTTFEGPNQHIANVKILQINQIALALAESIAKDFQTAITTFDTVQEAIVARLGRERISFIWDTKAALDA